MLFNWHRPVCPGVGYMRGGAPRSLPMCTMGWSKVRVGNSEGPEVWAEERLPLSLAWEFNFRASALKFRASALKFRAAQQLLVNERERHLLLSFQILL